MTNGTSVTDDGGLKRKVIVIGGGPAGLMAAERIATQGLTTILFERMPSVARKFLLAGRGGLNLTHSEPTDVLLRRYGPRRATLESAVRGFSADDVVAWCAALGIETFTGTSGRIFPRQLKTSPLLRAWLRRLDGLGVDVALRHRWTGWTDDGALVFDTPAGSVERRADAVVIALGGASWPRLGSDGAWTGTLQAAGVGVAPLQPANCGFAAAWSPYVVERFAGAPIKRTALTFEDVTVRGEALVTSDGIEGGVVYALSAALRDAIARDGVARPTLDLRPDLTVDQLSERLANARGARSLSTHLRKAAGLAPVGVALLREAGAIPADPAGLAARIKAAPLTLNAPKGLERAISTAGGVRMDELDERFMLKRRPGVFMAGEMLDWEAPTGGYLLQATFSTAVAAADGAIAWARRG